MNDARRLGRTLFDAGGDEALGRLAVERGWLRPEQLGGGDPAEPLGRRLLRAGLLTPERYLKLVGIGSGELAWCRACDGEYDPRAASACPACSGASRRIGRFEILGQVARGGIGVVLEARDPSAGRRVALKVIPEREAAPQAIERLRREAEVARALDHPNIVRIYETGMARDPSGQPLHYIAMELVQGRTLAQILRERALGREALLGIFRSVVGAVAYAHARGVLHRDLKPSNILVEASGRAVLADFGLARDPAAEPMLTPSHALMGTLLYMAPEQVEGATRRIDARTDVFALGVILYEILEGRHPFEARSQERLLERILKEDPPAPAGPWGAICAKALAKDPGARWRDGGALEAALRGAAAEPAVE
jgi:serine/threonine-protein kinase